MPIAVGQRVVFAPFGIGTIARTLGALVGGKSTPCFGIAIEVGGLVIENKGDSQDSMNEVAPAQEIVVSMESAPTRLRDLADADSARAVLARLAPGDGSAFRAATFGERLHLVDHALRSGSLDACADLLCQTLPILLGRDATSFGERKAIHALERVVIGEIALALSEPADALAERVRVRLAPSAR